jgi:hypothetical protein
MWVRRQRRKQGPREISAPVLAPPESVMADDIRNAPEEVDPLAMTHYVTIPGQLIGPHLVLRAEC